MITFLIRVLLQLFLFKKVKNNQNMFILRVRIELNESPLLDINNY